MKISKETVEHVAHLGRLELEPEEIELYTQQIDSILQHMDSLTSLKYRRHRADEPRSASGMRAQRRHGERFLQC